MRAPLLLLVLTACSGGVAPPPGKDDQTDDTASGDVGLELSVDAIDFGELSYAEFATTTIQASNPGVSDLVINSLTTVEPFRVSPSNLVLHAGASSTITVYCQPTSYGTFADNLVLATDDAGVGTVNVALTASTIADADGDGYDTVDAGGEDCDDSDATVNPDADEIWYDEVDENCDGSNDFDRDGDGYDAETDEHEVEPELVDCNDSSADFYPGAPDEPYDNRDTNCDGSNDWDADDDGSEATAHGGYDCDDTDPDVNRSGNESFNGKDDDCDGFPDLNALARYQDYAYDPKASWDQFGYSVATGDLDADGDAEVIAGAPYYDATSASDTGYGAVAIFEGGSLLPTGTRMDRADNFLDGNNDGDLLGTYVTVLGDYDGDGVNDLAIGAMGASSNTGAVYVLGGDDALSGDLSDVMATYTGSASGYFGRGIGTEIDLNADGYDELVVAYASGSNNYVALQYGEASPNSASVSSMDIRWSTDGQEVQFYRNAPVGGDFDGDGYDDLILCDGEADYGGSTDNGSVWAVWGRGAAYTSSATDDIGGSASTIARGDADSDYVGWACQIGEDWDGDGDDELWIYQGGVAMYVFPGGETGRDVLDLQDDAAVTYTWDSSVDAEMIRNAGDWDADGYGDMLVFLEDTSGEYGNSEMFSSTRQSGTFAEVDYTIGNLTGDADDIAGTNGNVGYGMSPLAQDIDANGTRDMVVGDDEWVPEGGGSLGRTYVLLNESQ